MRAFNRVRGGKPEFAELLCGLPPTLDDLVLELRRGSP
jgi:hypothetical protein